MKDYTSGAFEGYDPEDVKGLVKDRHDATVSYFEEVYDAVEELCEGVEEPRGEIQYIHYFCGVSGQSEESDEIYARLREKLYRLVSSISFSFSVVTYVYICVVVIEACPSIFCMYLIFTSSSIR